MDIVMIGSGNVATVLGRKSLEAGHRIVQVYSRNSEHAYRLAHRFNATSTSYISTIERNADLMIIALRDEVLPQFVLDLGKIKSIVTHTAGALPLQSVSGLSDAYGVIYPLQSLRREIELIPPMTILVDGNSAGTTGVIKNFASSLSASVLETDDQTRLKYHLAATIVNNFTNHLFTLAASLCEKENLSFAVLQPLMEETVLRLRNISPADAQTGPAIRNDQATILKHRQLLKDYPTISKFYEMFTVELQKFALSV